VDIRCGSCDAYPLIPPEYQTKYFNAQGQIMKRVTLGKLVMDTARGDKRERVIPAKEIKELRRDISERITPKIEEIREEQRRALEESKPLVLL
jgi:hypothetical protein